ncbi:MAG TPA: DUF1376 domain-containing protein [Acidobacteriaceae bacterium]|jgi:uncharacterized protein YdaU (DUF1376 family)
MAQFPALPFWTDTYLADASHLTDAEHGRYLLIIVHMWRAPEIRLPNDDEWLARKFGRSVEDVQKLFRPLLEEFFKSTGNWLTHKRLQREREYLLSRSKKQSARAKLRWEKEDDECRGIATPGNASSGYAPTPTPTPTPTPQKKELSSSKSLKGDFDGFWDVCPKKVGKGAAFKAYAKARTKTDHQTLCDAVRRYAATRVGEDVQFTVHPATWLNAERWLDQAGASGAAQLGLQLTDEEKREELETLKRLGVA